MASVGFWTPVTYQPLVPSLGKRLLENVDAYFCLGGRKVCVIQGYERGNSEGVVPLNEPASRTLLKVVSYCTLIIPALVFIAKLVLRYIYRFHMINLRDLSRPPPFLGGSDILPSSPPSASRLLEFDRKYRLSDAEIAKLCIQIQYDKRGHDLPQMDTNVYKIPPRVNIGFSVLPAYQNSYFEYVYCKNSSSRSLEFEVTRKNKNSSLDPSFLQTARQLTIEETIDLKLLPISHALAVSIRKEFKDFLFEYIVCAPDNSYLVQKVPVNRKYPFLPFNQAVNLKGEDIRSLCLCHEECKYFDGWVVGLSSLPEYANSVLLIREGNPTSTFVRMLKT